MMIVDHSTVLSPKVGSCGAIKIKKHGLSMNDLKEWPR
jgi:hypothetical protein